jgi:hypothetical protein
MESRAETIVDEVSTISTEITCARSAHFQWRFTGAGEADYASEFLQSKHSHSACETGTYAACIARSSNPRLLREPEHPLSEAGHTAKETRN